MSWTKKSALPHIAKNVHWTARNKRQVSKYSLCSVPTHDFPSTTAKTKKSLLLAPKRCPKRHACSEPRDSSLQALGHSQSHAIHVGQHDRRQSCHCCRQRSVGSFVRVDLENSSEAQELGVDHDPQNLVARSTQSLAFPALQCSPQAPRLSWWPETQLQTEKGDHSQHGMPDFCRCSLEVEVVEEPSISAPPKVSRQGNPWTDTICATCSCGARQSSKLHVRTREERVAVGAGETLTMGSWPRALLVAACLTVSWPFGEKVQLARHASHAKAISARLSPTGSSVAARVLSSSVRSLRRRGDRQALRRLSIRRTSC